VAKDEASLYRSGRTLSWLKVSSRTTARATEVGSLKPSSHAPSLV
jgi:hypothetical protein